MDGRTDRKMPLDTTRSPIPLSIKAGQANHERGCRYCIPCAISRPDFRERAPIGHPTPLQEGEQCEA